MKNITKDQAAKLSGFLQIVMILVMISNIEHCANVYYWISNHTFETFFAGNFPVYQQTGVVIDWVVSYLVVIVFDLAVIVMVRAGKYISASVYAVGILALLLVYYDGLSFFDRELVDRRVAQITFSVFFAFSIVRFAMLYAELQQLLANKDQEEAEVLQMHAKLSDLEVELLQRTAKEYELTETINKLEESNLAYLNKLTTAQTFASNLQATWQQFKALVKEERVCPYCTSEWANKSAMISHKGSCDKKPLKTVA